MLFLINGKIVEFLIEVVILVFCLRYVLILCDLFIIRVLVILCLDEIVKKNVRIYMLLCGVVNILLEVL